MRCYRGACERKLAISRVLVIEDEFLVAMHIAQVVEEAGCDDVAMARGEEQALAVASKAKPDLVLADLDLGRGGDGISAVRQIRRHADVPLIVITGNPEQVPDKLGKLVAVIAKPFDESKLKELIRQTLHCLPTACLTNLLF